MDQGLDSSGDQSISWRGGIGALSDGGTGCPVPRNEGRASARIATGLVEYQEAKNLQAIDATVTNPDVASGRGLVDARSLDAHVSVIIPALNEADNLPYVLPRIPAWVSEVLIVDGWSTDGTPEVAQELMPDVRIIQQSGRGKGNALRTGFAAATGDIIVMLDADGSMDPREIPAFVGALLAGADMAKGSRFLQGGGTRDMPFYRKWGNGVFVLLTNILFGGRYSDLCYGYAAFWRSMVPALCIDCDGFEVETLLNVRALRAGWRVSEVPSFEAPRVHGIGRLRTIPDGWRVLKSLLREAVHHYTRREIGSGVPGPAIAANEAA
jgi:Glycosyl transferase family 2